MASFEGAKKLASKPVEPAKGDEGLGPVGSFVRGLAQVPGDAIGTLGAAMPFAGFPGLGGRPNPGLLAARPEGAQQAAGDLSQRLMGLTGTTAEPAGFVGRVAERLGRGAPYTALAVPYLASLGGAKAVGMGIIGDVASSISSQFAADAGAGPVGQTLAGFAGVFVPSGIPDVVTDTARGASRFAREAAEAADFSLTPAQTKELAGLASDFGMQSDEMIDAIKGWSSVFPFNPDNPRQHIEAGIEALEEARRLWPDPKLRPPVASILSEVGGANLAQLDAGLAKNTAYNARVADLRLRVAKDLEERWDSMVPNSSGPSLNAAAKAERQRLRGVAQNLWENVPTNEMPHAKLGPIEKAADAIENGIEADRGLLKDQIAVLTRLRARFGDSVPMSQIQGLRSDLLEIIRDGEGPFADAVARKRAGAAGRLMEPIEKYVDSLPDQGSAAYKAAREATADLHRRFSPKSNGIRAILQMEEGVAIARTIKRSPNSVAEVRRVKNAIEGQDGAIESLKMAFWDDLFDGDLTQFTPRQIRGKLRGKRAMYAEVFGPERLQQIDDLLTMADIARRGVTGTAAEARVAGSNRNAIQMFLSGGLAMAEPGTALAKATNAVSQEVNKAAKDNFWRQAVFMEFMLDGDLAERAMKIPVGRDVEQWKVSWMQALARARARNAARLAMGARRASTTISAEEGERSWQENISGEGGTQ